MRRVSLLAWLVCVAFLTFSMSGCFLSRKKDDGSEQISSVQESITSADGGSDAAGSGNDLDDGSVDPGEGGNVVTGKSEEDARGGADDMALPEIEIPLGQLDGAGQGDAAGEDGNHEIGIDSGIGSTGTDDYSGNPSNGASGSGSGTSSNTSGESGTSGNGSGSGTGTSGSGTGTSGNTSGGSGTSGNTSGGSGTSDNTSGGESGSSGSQSGTDDSGVTFFPNGDILLPEVP